VLGEFLESGGMIFKLLKLIMEMIISLFLIIAGNTRMILSQKNTKNIKFVLNKI